jgi:hypothetical protein
MVVHPASKHAAQDELDILEIPAKPKLARAIGESIASPDKLPAAIPNGIDDRAIEANSG